jgi:hypothetical protein
MVVISSDLIVVICKCRSVFECSERPLAQSWSPADARIPHERGSGDEMLMHLLDRNSLVLQGTYYIHYTIYYDG